MTANASKDNRSARCIMYPAGGRIAEAILLIMQAYGIRVLEVKKFRSANFERCIGAIDCFDGVPEEMLACAAAVKDALAAIIASIGILKLDIDADDDDKKTLKENYAQLLELHKMTLLGTANSCEIVKEPVKAPSGPEDAAPAAEATTENAANHEPEGK